MTFVFNIPSPTATFVFSVPNVTIGGVTCADATVVNSDSSYTNTVASGGTLVTPDIFVSVDNSENNVLSNYFPSVKDVTMVLPDTDYNIYIGGVLQTSFSLPTLKDETINILWQ